ISTEIADIFRSNALKNGLLPVVVDEDSGAWLTAHPGAEVTLDVAAAALTLPTGARVPFPLEPFARHCLLEGIDELGFLLARRAESEAFEGRSGKPGSRCFLAMGSARRSRPKAFAVSSAWRSCSATASS